MKDASSQGREVSHQVNNPLSPINTSTMIKSDKRIIEEVTKELPGEKILVKKLSGAPIKTTLKKSISGELLEDKSNLVHRQLVDSNWKIVKTSIEEEITDLSKGLVGTEQIPGGQLTPNLMSKLVATNQLNPLLEETLDLHTILTTTMVIENQIIEVVIDTGSGVSVCTPQFVQSLGLGLIKDSYHGPP